MAWKSACFSLHQISTERHRCMDHRIRLDTLRAVLTLTKFPGQSTERSLLSPTTLKPAQAHGSQSYLVVQSCGARCRQGRGHALLQG